METKDLVCIVCPRGCRLKVVEKEGKYIVTGNLCQRGVHYGIKEVTNPTRVVTTTVKVIDSSIRRMPVVTKGSIPKKMIFDAMDVINRVELKTPITMGDVIVENILGTGINVVASRTVAK